jgi:DNA-binding beta-propeller fold protein YncE
VLLVLGYIVVSRKNEKISNATKESSYQIGSFAKGRSCARPPKFLKKFNIPQPVIIDLSQKRFKGIALLYGKDFQKVLHPKQWEQYGHFGTYALSQAGDMYLAPIPYISILPATFNLQKKLYKIDSKTAKLSIFMDFEDILPSASNPYGLDAIAYDCEDKTLWVASIDKSDYQSQKGVIYHIDPDTKEILQKVEGFDVLSMTIVKSEKGKYLLVGSARDNGLYAYTIDKGKLSTTPQKLLELPVSNQHIRKIKITDKNALELQSIPFSYALIAQTAKQDRIYHNAIWDRKLKRWVVQKKD